MKKIDYVLIIASVIAVLVAYALTNSKILLSGWLPVLVTLRSGAKRSALSGQQLSAADWLILFLILLAILS